MMDLNYVPLCAEWVYSPGDAIATVAVSDQDSNKIYIYDGQGTNRPLRVLDKLHTKPVIIMKVSNCCFLQTSFYIITNHLHLTVQSPFRDLYISGQSWNLGILDES